MRMYRIPQYEVNDIAVLRSVIEKYPLATVTSVFEGKPHLNHLPISADITSSGKIHLIGHMSRHNPQWKHIRDGSELNVAFLGPHAYINPGWYTENDVPTWNYVSVHATGKATLIESYPGLLHILKQLTDHMNRTHRDQWDFFIPEDLASERDLTGAIIGFEMTPDNVVGKFKLSQRRSKEDQRRVMEALHLRHDESSKQLGAWMSKNL